MWHWNLGHINENRLEQIKMVGNGMNTCNEKDLSLGESCVKGKQHRMFPKGPTTRVIKMLELIHNDICGPLNPPTHIRNQYFITFINKKSRYTMNFWNTSLKL